MIRTSFLLHEADPAEFPESAPIPVRVNGGNGGVSVDLVNEDGVLMAQVLVEYAGGDVIAYCRPFDGWSGAADDSEGIVLIPEVRLLPRPADRALRPRRDRRTICARCGRTLDLGSPSVLTGLGTLCDPCYDRRVGQLGEVGFWARYRQPDVS